MIEETTHQGTGQIRVILYAKEAILGYLGVERWPRNSRTEVRLMRRRRSVAQQSCFYSSNLSHTDFVVNLQDIWLEILHGIWRTSLSVERRCQMSIPRPFHAPLPKPASRLLAHSLKIYRGASAKQSAA
jgi:hypothetical protein